MVVWGPLKCRLVSISGLNLEEQPHNSFSRRSLLFTVLTFLFGLIVQRILKPAKGEQNQYFLLQDIAIVQCNTCSDASISHHHIA